MRRCSTCKNRDYCVIWDILCNTLAGKLHIVMCKGARRAIESIDCVMGEECDRNEGK